MKQTDLYDGEVKLIFNPDAPRYRYRVSDSRLGTKDKPTRGVTTLLRDILHKPDLLMWPLNEGLTFLFGDPKEYKAMKGFLRPGQSYTHSELENALESTRKAHTKKSDKGKDVGTMVHESIEAYLTGQPEPTFDADAENLKLAKRAVEAFKVWWEALDDKRILAVEKPIYSRSLDFAGTCDLVAEIDGKVYMLDFMSTNKSRVAPMGIYAEYFLQIGAYAYAFKEESGVEFDDCGIINVGKDGKIKVACASDMGMTVEDCSAAFAQGAKLHDWQEKTTKLTKDSHFVSHLPNNP